MGRKSNLGLENSKKSKSNVSLLVEETLETPHSRTWFRGGRVRDPTTSNESRVCVLQPDANNGSRTCCDEHTMDGRLNLYLDQNLVYKIHEGEETLEESKVAIHPFQDGQAVRAQGN